MRILFSMLMLCGLSFAQSPDWTTVPGGTHVLFQLTSGYVLRAAEKMPEEHYSFKPADTVRSFGEMAGHIADAQYRFCGTIIGDGQTGPGLEKGAKSKAEIVAGLKAAFAYCESAYASTTDANASTLVTQHGAQRTRLGVLNFNNMHVHEHYGNLVTYMRIKGVVPPSSEGR